VALNSQTGAYRALAIKADIVNVAAIGLVFGEPEANAKVGIEPFHVVRRGDRLAADFFGYDEAGAVALHTDGQAPRFDLAAADPLG
jgi:hypothetical protein